LKLRPDGADRPELSFQIQHFSQGKNNLAEYAYSNLVKLLKTRHTIRLLKLGLTDYEDRKAVYARVSDEIAAHAEISYLNGSHF
jgi:hypothetical protein